MRAGAFTPSILRQPSVPSGMAATKAIYDSGFNAARKVSRLVRTFKKNYNGLPPISLATAIAKEPNITEGLIENIFPSTWYRQVDPIIKKVPEFGMEMARGLGGYIYRLPQIPGPLGQELIESPLWRGFQALSTGGVSELTRPITQPILEKSAKDWVKIAERNEKAFQRSAVSPEMSKNLFAYQLGSGIGSIGTSILLTIATKSPHAAALSFGLMTKADSYRKAREKGLSSLKSTLISTGAGVTEGALEYIGLAQFMKPAGAGLRGIAKRALIESSQEASQELGGGFWDVVAGEKRDNLVQDVITAAGIGAILGGAAHVPLSLVQEQADVSEIKKEYGLSDAQAKLVIKTAYDGGFLEEPQEPELPKYAININLNRINAREDVKKLILETAEENKEAIEEARRGIVPNIETIKLAEELGMTQEELSKRKKGEAFSAEQAVAARSLLVASAQYVNKLSKSVSGGENTDEDLVKFRLAVEKHRIIQEEVSGVAAEAGRALQSFNILAEPEAGRAASIKKMLEALGGREITEEIAQKMAGIDPMDQIAVNKFISEVYQATTEEKVREAWIHSILSGPPTHGRNLTSNTLITLTKQAERFGTAGIDFGRAKITGTARERFFGEAPAAIYGTIQGVPRGVSQALYSFINEVSVEGETKLEMRKHAIKGRLGKVVRIPGRFLVAADEFFKVINYSAEIEARAYRQAAGEGKKGKELAARIVEIRNNPSTELKNAAWSEAEVQTFTQEPGKIGRSFVNFMERMHLSWLVMPFKRTPMNILKYGMQRTPYQFVRIAQNKLLAEKEAKWTGGKLSEELSKAMMGSTIMASTFILTMLGYITGGGPKDREKRKTLEATGWQPYSIKIGKEYYSYGGIEPMSTIVGISADFSELMDQIEDVEAADITGKILMSVTENFINKTYMSGISRLFKAIMDPDQFGETWINSIVSSAVPRFVNQMARAYDPYLRSPGTSIESLKAAIPYLSKEVVPRRNIWGEPIRAGGTFLERFVSPVYRRKAKIDALSKEIKRLKIEIGYPARSPGGVRLSDEEYNEYIEKAGKLSKDNLDRLIKSEEYISAGDVEKEDLIKQTIEDARTYIRPEIMTSDRPGGEEVVEIERQYDDYIEKNPNLSKDDRLVIYEVYRDAVDDVIKNEIIPKVEGSSKDGWKEFYEMYSQKNDILEASGLSWNSKYAKEIRTKFKENIDQIAEDNPGFLEEFARYPSETWRR